MQTPWVRKVKGKPIEYSNKKSKTAIKSGCQNVTVKEMKGPADQQDKQMKGPTCNNIVTA